MTRLSLCAILFALSLAAQDAKVAPDPKLPPAPSERQLRADEITAAQLADTQVQLLQEKYKINEYLEKAKAPTAAYNAVKTEACKSVGVPEAEMNQWCGFVTGLDKDGNPILGPDGKPTPAKVWNAKPKQEEKPAK